MPRNKRARHTISEAEKANKWQTVDQLILAVRAGDLTKVKELVEQGVQVNSEMGKVLVKAVKSGSLAVVQYLIEQGADMNHPAHYGDMPLLHRTVKNNHLEIMKYLLEQGADINEIEPYDCGGTPLHIAVYEHNYKMIDLLLERGANIKIPHKDGWTPICCAIVNGDMGMVEHLMKGVSDINFKDKLVHRAINFRQPTIANYLNTLQLPDVIIYRSLTAEEMVYKKCVYDSDKEASVKDKYFSNEEIPEKVAEISKQTNISSWKQFFIFDIQMAVHKIGEKIPERPVFEL